MKNRMFKHKIGRVILIIAGCSLLVTLIGCDAFVRKFTRKPKKEDLRPEEMVLAPEEYTGPRMTKEELYRQYLLFWKSWQAELVTALSSNANHKKRIGCAEQAIKNLEQMRLLLNEDKQRKLTVYINQLRDLQDALTQDTYGSEADNYRLIAERLKRDILRDFSYEKIKNCLI